MLMLYRLQAALRVAAAIAHGGVPARIREELGVGFRITAGIGILYQQRRARLGEIKVGVGQLAALHGMRQQPLTHMIFITNHVVRRRIVGYRLITLRRAVRANAIAQYESVFVLLMTEVVIDALTFRSRRLPAT